MCRDETAVTAPLSPLWERWDARYFSSSADDSETGSTRCHLPFQGLLAIELSGLESEDIVEIIRVMDFFERWESLSSGENLLIA